MTATLRPHAFRMAWAALALMHIPPLFRVSASLSERYADPAAWLGAAGLALTTLFFILKVCDVAFLRFRATRASMMAFVLATILVHQNATHSVLVSLAEPPAAATLATCLLSVRIYRSRKVRNLLKHLTQTGRRALHNLPLAHSLADPLFCIRPEFVRLRSRTTRAPPFRCR